MSSNIRRVKLDLSVVGNISGVYKYITHIAPVIPNFPIMLNVILAGTSDTSPEHNRVKRNYTSKYSK